MKQLPYNSLSLDGTGVHAYLNRGFPLAARGYERYDDGEELPSKYR